MNLPMMAGLAFTLFALWMLKHALRNYRLANASLGWASVRGQLVKVRLWGKRKVGAETREAENLSVEFAYEVAGKQYSGTTVAFYTLVYPETVEVAERFTQGASVEVFFDPARPHRSVLMPGPKGGNKSFSEILLALLGLASAIAVTVGGATGYIG